MLGKRPYLPSFGQDRPSPNPVSSSSASACCRVVIGFEIVKEDGNRPPTLNMHRNTSLAAMPSLFSHKKGNPSFQPDKPGTSLVVDPPTTTITTTTTTTTPPGTLAIPNPKQHLLPLAQSEVEKKTATKSVPWWQSQVGNTVNRSVFESCMETKGLPTSYLSSSSSCFEESSCEHPARLDFLQSCFFCRRFLSMARDIYMYRGDRAFCSVECRYQQIVIDEWNDRCSPTSFTPGA